jgi:hypothetical protein
LVYRAHAVCFCILVTILDLLGPYFCCYTFVFSLLNLQL